MALHVTIKVPLTFMLNLKKSVYKETKDKALLIFDVEIYSIFELEKRVYSFT